MNSVKPKKHLGQHFLKDQNIARKIVESLGVQVQDILEVGPGTGVLTRLLEHRPGQKLYVIEIDHESANYLTTHFPDLQGRIFCADFLKFDVSQCFTGQFLVIGNFPYNISSQIFFRILEWRNQVPEVVGMVQKEVAERICSREGSRVYGILSVLLQAFYDIEYLFTVSESVFYPPPRVKSAVIRLRRNEVTHLPCNEEFFVNVVKTAFNQRRKMLRNSLKEISAYIPDEFAEKRPEQLPVSEFIRMVKILENQ